MNVKTIEWRDDKVVMIDQRVLPIEEVYVECEDYKQVADAIKTMVIRGAPAIGVAAAMGVAQGALGIDSKDFATFEQKLNHVCEVLLATRPTAVNLRWGVERMKHKLATLKNLSISEIKQELKKEAITIMEEDIAINRQMGDFGQTLLNSGDTVLTHCNAGALATAGWGTALGVIYSAKAAGKTIEVYADETRPFLQGARLTAWELMKNNIHTTLITDNMAASIMRQKKIKAVIVGADRIAANGDVANKIGTYGVAILAKEHDIPFYVAAPLSTIDIRCPTGDQIPIEERSAEEVTNFYRQRVAPDGIHVRNPAFDVTPNSLVTAIITEKGIIKAPYLETIKKLF
ncbi:MAG: S-methyl-5-thioribose-1-phosphate isomerase [Deltaproteobacteria bacterium]|nr:MAG: S-methyl-5-thioribose-1-phosphate isomerase [Deltaproteobacteria bacterium]